MEKTINLNEIKLDKNHKYPIEKQIELGEDVLITMKACCIQHIIGDNQEGTVNMTYVVKPINVIIDHRIVYEKETGKVEKN